MIDFLTGCFDLLFDVIAQSNNILVLLPFCAIVLFTQISRITQKTRFYLINLFLTFGTVFDILYTVNI